FAIVGDFDQSGREPRLLKRFRHNKCNRLPVKHYLFRLKRLERSILLARLLVRSAWCWPWTKLWCVQVSENFDNTWRTFGVPRVYAFDLALSDRCLNDETVCKVFRTKFRGVLRTACDLRHAIDAAHFLSQISRHRISSDLTRHRRSSPFEVRVRSLVFPVRPCTHCAQVVSPPLRPLRLRS